MEITKDLIKIFVDWTKIKVRIHVSNVKKFPRERQIWWVSLGQNIGVETNGKNESFERPVLVVKKYNNDSLLVLPISGKIKNGIYYFKFINNDGKENIVNLSQLRMISQKRFIRKIWKMKNTEYLEIKKKLKNSI